MDFDRRPSRWILPGAALLALALGFVLSDPALAITLPPNFVAEVAVQGLDTPTCIAFLPDGRLLIGEKRGRVRIAKNGVIDPDPFWQSENEVLNAGDMGLMSIAVDRNFTTNHRVYFLYVVDPDTNGVDDNPYAFGRITRYQISASDSNMVNYSSRVVVLGTDWRHGPLVAAQSHTVGSLRWGEDGSLLVSCGDGGSGGVVDAGGQYPLAFGTGKTDPNEDIGAFRAQDPTSLCGKILRINPQTGAGYSTNPYATGDLTLNKSKVWSYGFRNPFRFTVRPGTGKSNPNQGDPGTLMIGEVGWVTWEELDVAALSGRNFGWPCKEGPNAHAAYTAANPAHNGCSSIGTPSNPGVLTLPTMAWHHSNPALSQPPGIFGNCSIMGAFYTGTRYPPQFQNNLFFSDFGTDWLRMATFDANENLVEITDFATGLASPVDFATDPGGDLYYVAIGQGQVWRFRYAGPVSGGPVAGATADRVFGYAPLDVIFSSESSYSPGGNPLTISWDLGDGTGSTDDNPVHTYTHPGAFRVTLTVEDDQGRLSRDTIDVVAVEEPAFPSTPVVDNFNRPDGAVGGAWIHQIETLAISDSALIQGGGITNAVWNGAAFGPDQEAYVTLMSITAGVAHHDLMLKIQGLTDESGHVQVRYDASYPRFSCATYTPADGWVTRGIFPIAQALVPGDVFGGRATGDGWVEVYKNGVRVGICSYASWPMVDKGGRIGISLTEATSTRLENFGGGNVAGGFPSTPVQDNFNRPNQALTLPWVGDRSGLLVSANALTSSGVYSAPVYSGASFGPNQEAYVRLNWSSVPGSSYGLLLKVQGDSLASGAVMVRYDVPGQYLSCATYSKTQGWVAHGEYFLTQPLAPGDVLGARAYSSGTVEVFVNGGRMARFNCADWPFVIYGGRLGLAVVSAPGAWLDDFGGGETDVDNNSPPVPTILLPAVGSFYVEGDTLHLSGKATDDRDASSLLIRKWQVDLHHNTHIHPSFFTSPDSIASLVTENHDDGTGTFLRVHYSVTDSWGASDTTHVDVYPQVDLTAGKITYLPSTPVTWDTLTIQFTIRNNGGMLAPFSRWMLLAGAVELAARDTLVGAHDSVRVTVKLPPTLAPATYVLRAVVDTLAQVVETNEANNASVAILKILEGPDITPPLFTVGPTHDAWGVHAFVRWRSNEPSRYALRYGYSPEFGYTVTGDSLVLKHDVLVTDLAPSTLYYFQVEALDTLGNSRLSALDSLSTSGGPLGPGPGIPDRLALSAGFPNPAHSMVNFALDMPRPARLDFAIYDLQGREVWSSTETRDAGRYTLTWPGTARNGSRVQPGLYLVRIEVGGDRFVRRVALLH